jgi:hypothetical protein
MLMKTYDEFFLSSGFFFAVCEPFVPAENYVEYNNRRVQETMYKKNFTYFARRYEFGVWLWIDASAIHLFWPPAMHDVLSKFGSCFACSLNGPVRKDRGHQLVLLSSKALPRSHLPSSLHLLLSSNDCYGQE